MYNCLEPEVQSLRYMKAVYMLENLSGALLELPVETALSGRRREREE